MITNGYNLMPDRIQRLNRAGLDHLQISIDNVMPDDVSKKSLKVLDKKLQMLAEHAEFHVNINSVVGGGIHNPDDALVVGRRAIELGFSATVGIIHDGDGQLRPLGERERAVYHEMKTMEKRNFARFNGFRTLSLPANRTTGAAAPVPAICTFVRTGWCIIARSNAAIPVFHSKNTRKPMSFANTTPKRPALRSAP